MAAMKIVLAAICCFTAAASCWLVAIYFVLKHPGYEWRAAIAALFVLQSALTLAALAGAAPAWLRAGLLAGACGIVWAGYSAISSTLAATHFEGFWLPIGAGLIVQGALTLAVYFRSLALLSRRLG
jgi:hypothetical protein